MATIDLNVSGTAITVSNGDVQVNRNNFRNESIEFKNNSTHSLTVAFSSSPFTESSQIIAGGGQWSPSWATAPSMGDHNYTVSGSGLTQGTGDIDIKTTPLP